MLPAMAITPLYTIAELTTEITAWKACLTALAAGRSYTISNGGSSQSFTAQDIDVVRKQLEWFQSQRAELESAGRSAVLVGRPAR